MDRKQEILITRSLQLVVEAQDAQDSTFGTRNLIAHFGTLVPNFYKLTVRRGQLDPDMP